MNDRDQYLPIMLTKKNQWSYRLQKSWLDHPYDEHFISNRNVNNFFYDFNFWFGGMQVFKKCKWAMLISIRRLICIRGLFYKFLLHEMHKNKEQSSLSHSSDTDSRSQVSWRPLHIFTTISSCISAVTALSIMTDNLWLSFFKGESEKRKWSFYPQSVTLYFFK